MFYVGWVPLVAIFLAFAFRKGKKEPFLYTSLFLSFALVSFWLAGGAYTFFNRTGHMLDTLLQNHGYLTGSHGVLFISLALSGGLCTIYFSTRKFRPLTLLPQGWRSLTPVFLPLILSVLIFSKPFMVLRITVPLYSHSRSPTWFASVMPSFAVSFGLACVVIVLGNWLKKKEYWFLSLVVLAGLITADFYPYRKYFHLYYRPDIVRDLKEISTFVANDKETFRILPRESYNPLLDMGIIYSGKPSAWAWLNWDSPKHTSELVMGKIYPNLHRPETIDEALELSGRANIKYVMYSLFEGPPPPRTSSLKLAKKATHFLVYENLKFRPFVQIYTASEKNERPAKKVPQPLDEDLYTLVWSREGPGEIRVDIENGEACLLVVAESWYPGWEVCVNGEESELLRANEAFLGVSLPAAKNEVTFRYKKPYYFLLGYLITLGSICGLVGYSIHSLRKIQVALPLNLSKRNQKDR